MIPDPHEDDHPELMLGKVLIFFLLLVVIGIISSWFLSGAEG